MTTSTKYRIEFKIAGLPPTTNSNGRAHWAVKAKAARMWRDLVIMAIGRNRPRSPLVSAKLTLIRFSSSEADFDGLVSSMKHVIDGLVDARVIIDDRMSNIGQPTYKWEKCSPKEGHIRVIVEEV